MTGQLSETAIEFLTARALDVELALHHGLRSDGGGDVLAFPFKQAGVEVGAKFRKLPKERFWQTKGGVGCAWNGDVLARDDLLKEPVVITEGELDALAAIQSGFLRTISVPDGAPPPGERGESDLRSSAKFDWLKPLREHLKRDRAPVIVIAADGDQNGGAMLQQLSVLLGRVRCKYLTYPLARDPEARGRARLKDLNEVLEEYGEAGVQRVIRDARWLQVDGVYAMSELPPLPAKYVYSIGYNLLSENLKVRLGDFSVVTGIPSHGKSAWVNDLWCRVANTHGLKIAWASFEQEPQADHRRNLRAWFCENRESQLSGAEIAHADEWIDRHHRFIVPKEEDDVSLDWVLQRAEQAVVQHGCHVVVIDPWNELDHIREKHLSLTEYVNAGVKELKRFARAFRVHVQVVAHPTKQVKGEGGVYRRPTLYDISDSAAWYNKAELGVIVHRPNPEETEVVVEKSRYHETIGVPGKVVMAFNRDTRRYHEVGRELMWLDPATRQSA